MNNIFLLLNDTKVEGESGWWERMFERERCKLQVKN